MANGLTPIDRFPEEKQRLRRALSRLGIQTAEPSGLVITGEGVAVLAQDPIFVDSSGVGLDYGNGLVLSGTSLVVDPQAPIFVDGSGVGLTYDTAYFDVPVATLTFASPITGAILTTSTITIDSDSSCLYLGDGQDMSVCYDGTDGVLDTSLIAASDLVVTCGTEKTLELTTGVYRDTNIGAATLSGPPGLRPDTVNFLDNVGADTGIATLGFAVGEAISGTFEIQHDYKEGTDLSFHLHYQGIAAPTGTDNVRWELSYTIAENMATVGPVTTIELEGTFDTQYELVFAFFAAISGTGVEIGDQFLFTLTRIASVGDAYSGDALLATVGIHYQVDTLGSRQIAVK